MLLTVKQRILLTLLRHGRLQNSDIAKRVGVTEQWVSQLIRTLHKEGLIESRFLPPRRINTLSRKGLEVAKYLEQISGKAMG